MVNKSIAPDSDTYIAVLKACGLVGDVKTAYNALMVFNTPFFKCSYFSAYEAAKY